MSHLARRSLFLVAGACLVAAPAPARGGGGHGLFHHHGHYSQTTTTTQGVVPAAALIGVAPAATYYTAAPAVPLAYPALAVAPLAFPAAAAPAYLAASPPAAAYGAPPAAMAAAQLHAFSAPAAQAALASGSYPGLAQAAQRARGWDGGRFVLFLRHLIRGVAGSNGTGAIAILRPILLNFLRAELGIDPATSGLVAEVERLLGELGGDPATPGSGPGQCFTIRVCIDGGTPRVSTGGSLPPATENGPTPGLALPPASPPSSQTPGLAQPQSGGSDDKAPPAPTVPSLSPAPAASLPTTDADIRRHDEVMAALGSIGESLKKIAEKK